MPEERYAVEMEPSVLKDMRRFPKADAKRIVQRMRGLGQDPRPVGCVKLGPDEFRIRQGSFRIVYRVDDPARVVVVTRVGDRKDVYRRR